jgi:hypothetical protein
MIGINCDLPPQKIKFCSNGHKNVILFIRINPLNLGTVRYESGEKDWKMKKMS